MALGGWGVKDFMTTVPKPYQKKRDDGGNGGKNCPKLCDVIYERPLKFMLNINIPCSYKLFRPSSCLNSNIRLTFVED